MDDRRIRELAEEVLSKLAAAPDPVTSDLESRVAALEAAVRELMTSRPAPAAAAVLVASAHAHPHPSLRVLDVPCGEDRCLLEPDRPCVGSGRCRTFGH